MSAAKKKGPELPEPAWRDRLKALSNIPPLFRMVWEAAPRAVVPNVLCRLVAALIPVAVLEVTRLIIDSLYSFLSHQKALPHYFWWLVGIEFGLACTATILARLTDYFDVVLADLFERHISTRIMEHACRADLARFEDPLFYDKMDRARVQGTDRIGMIQSTGRLIQQVLTTVSLVGSILLFSPWILLILILFVVPAFLGETHFAFLGYSLNFQQTPARREMDYLRILGGSKESAKELKLFGLGPYLIERYKRISYQLHDETMSVAGRKLLVGSLLTVLGTVGYYGTYAFVIYQTVAGAISLGTMTFLAGAIAGASTNIQAVFTTFSGIADQAMFLQDLLDFFAVQPKMVSKPGALPAPRQIRQGVEFRNVSFGYPGNPRPLLKEINFTLQPGERVALVGENGQGKTTIVKLMVRLYDPTGGQILLDGVDLREFDLENLWKEIGVIFQDFVRYEMAARDNIAMGRIEAPVSAQQIREAAIKSLADPVIRRLPKRYEQILGSRFEEGIDLSGGEWQKIALARAYLREAQLLILDEPTAALDAVTEHEVFERFAELTAGKIALLISHRFSTVRMADRILVLQDGSIAEEGGHEQLIRNGGRYAEMFEMQASSYR